MKDELALAKETARKALYHAILQSWAMRDFDEAARAYRLANALHDPSAVPQAWVAQFCARAGRRSQRLALLGEDAVLRQDWPKALAAANEALEIFPTDYHLYWQKGAALFHLGKTHEALQPLQVYLRCCKDDLEYPEAREWLQQIQRAEAKPGTGGAVSAEQQSQKNKHPEFL